MNKGIDRAPTTAMAGRRILLALAGAVLAGGSAAALVLWRRFGPSTYKRFRTMFGKTRIYQVEDDDGQSVRLLEVGGIVQSGTYVDERRYELVFEYLKRYDVMFDAGSAIRDVCVLGCGGYDYPEHLIAHHPEVTVDAVEIDPAITQLARRYFFLDRLIAEYDAESTGRLNLICADALTHLQATSRTYDAIVNDTFDAGTPPAHLTTREFAQAVHDRLSAGGLYLTNIVCALDGPHSAFLSQQVALLESVFANVCVIPCSPDQLTEPDNAIVVATDAQLPVAIMNQARRLAR